MKKHALGVVLASLALLTACSGDPEEAADSAATEAAEEVQTAEPSEPTAEESTPAEDGASTVLKGMVGTEEDPEAFEISLTTEDGQPVTELPAGEYTIEVTDRATIHNFHLEGGSVDEATSVPDAEDATFQVTLEAGEYTYTCDPHPPMTGSFTVTA